MSDKLNFFGMTSHKLQLGFIIIIFDIFSTLIMIQIFYRLIIISEEYTTTIDDHEITMCDFAVMCHNVHLDKYTQNVPLIKMRVWLHFNNILQMADRQKYGKIMDNPTLMKELQEIRGDDSRIVDV